MSEVEAKMIKVTLCLKDNLFHLLEVQPEEKIRERFKHKKDLANEIRRVIHETTGFEASVTIGEIEPSTGILIMLSDVNLKVHPLVKMLEELVSAVYDYEGIILERIEDVHIQMSGTVRVNM